MRILRSEFCAFVMDIKKELEKFKKIFDPELEKYLDEAIEGTQEQDNFVADSLRHVKKMAMFGGKRLRPALMYYGYIGVGGENKKEIIKAAISVELIHLFLLIHDDTIDRDPKRRGVTTIHEKYKAMHKMLSWLDDSQHFGNSVAIIVGDMVMALGNKALFSSNFDPKIVVEALTKMQKIVANTVVGQAKDVVVSFKGKATEKEILDIYKLKTAKYTIESPLHLGAIFGGAQESVLKEFSRMSDPIGIAFQIQDDILGVFGSESKIGKTVGSDIAEGKQTILVSRAREKATAKQMAVLDAKLGKEKLTQRDIENFRSVIVETGALDYAKKLAKNYIAKGKEEVAKASIKKETKDFLLAAADYMMDRKV